MMYLEGLMNDVYILIFERYKLTAPQTTTIHKNLYNVIMYRASPQKSVP